METNNCGVYEFFCKIDGRKYIGKSKNIKVRIRRHINDLRSGKHDSSILQEAFDKHGENNFSFMVLEICSENLLDDREIYWIKERGSHITDGGFNISWGGKSINAGLKASSETKEKMRQSHLGIKEKPMSEEGRRNISESKRGEKNYRFGKFGKDNPALGTKLKSSSSKYFGVRIFKNRDSVRWRASVNYGNASTYLGTYKTEEDAARVRDKYVIENNLDYPLNFPNEVEITLSMRINRETLSSSRSGKKKNNASSKYYGVSYVKSTRVWRSYVRANGKSINISNHKIELDAAKAYNRYVIQNNLPNPLNGL
jgi:group I intron endonuclease